MAQGEREHGGVWHGGYLHTMVAILSISVLASACGMPAASGHRQGKKQISLAAVLKPTPAPASVTLRSSGSLGLSTVHFVDQQHGWMGGQGVILGTGDGGVTWQTEYVGTGGVTGFSMLSATEGFAATSAGLLKTQNGTTWNLVGTKPLAWLQFFSDSQGYALSEDEGGELPSLSLLKTQDGGETWRTVAQGSLDGACFFNLQDGITATSLRDGMQIRMTSDGGSSWVNGITFEGEAYAEQMICTPDGDAWMVMAGAGAMGRESYTLYRSVDRGASWSPVLTVPLAGFGAPGNPVGVATGPGTSPGPLAAVDGNHAMMLGVCYGCLGGDGTLTLDATSDGGTTWQAAKTPIPDAVPVTPMFLDMLSPLRAWLLTGVLTAGTSGPATQFLVQSTGDGGATWQGSLAPAAVVPIGGVQFVTSKLGYGLGVAGNARAVVRTENGGQSWQEIGTLPTSVPESYYALSVLPHGVLFVGAGHSLLISRNGGLTFSHATGPHAPYGIGTSGLAFSGKATGCTSALGPGGLVDYATRDGGKSWRRTRAGDVSAAICAEGLVDAPMARVAQGLVAKLAPRERGKGSSPAMYPAAYTAVGRGALWIVFPGTATEEGRLYVLGPGSGRVSVHELPGSMDSIGGLSALGHESAYLWTEHGKLFSTSDGGADWLQVPER